MALSDYDCLAFDWDGEPSNGIFQSHKNLGQLEIYKNWVYGRIGDRTIQFRYGDFDFEGMSVKVKEIPRGIMILCQRYGTAPEFHSEYACGVGVYGHMSDIEWLQKFHPVEFEKHKEILNKASCVNHYSKFGPDIDEWGISVYLDSGIQDIDLSHLGRRTLEDTWEGVSPVMFEQLMSWIENSIDKKAEAEAWLNKCRLNPLRFNQGNMFFSKRTGMDLCESAPGEDASITISSLLGLQEENK